MNTPLVLGVTGASGAPYALRLIRALIELRVPTYLIISTHGWRLLRLEAGIEKEKVLRQSIPGDWSRITIVSNSDRGAVPASGSVVTRGMVVCP